MGSSVCQNGIYSESSYPVALFNASLLQAMGGVVCVASCLRSVLFRTTTLQLFRGAIKLFVIPALPANIATRWARKGRIPT